MSGQIGVSAERVGGLARVTGAYQYVGDIRLADVLHVKLVTLPCARARIRTVDISAAERVPGVRLVMTAFITLDRSLANMPKNSFTLAGNRCRSTPSARNRSINSVVVVLQT